MNPAIVIDTFTYESFFILPGRGPVITGSVLGDASKVKNGMLISIGGTRFPIVGIETFKPLRPTRPIGLLVRGLEQKLIDEFSPGDTFSILEEK